jgi:hypothetical protein
MVAACSDIERDLVHQNLLLKEMESLTNMNACK